jgi:hypothetical protein
MNQFKGVTDMNANLKFLTSTVGAGVVALALVASASAQTRHQTYRHVAPSHSAQVCSDPGSHLGCAAAPSHMNDGAEAAGE